MRLLLPALALCLIPAAAHAQGYIDIRGIDRGPHSTLPPSLWYGYGPGVPWFAGMSRQQLATWDYLDRVDRAEKFGYDIPAPPPGIAPVEAFPRPQQPRRGLFRWRDRE